MTKNHDHATDHKTMETYCLHLCHTTTEPEDRNRNLRGTTTTKTTDTDTNSTTRDHYQARTTQQATSRSCFQCCYGRISSTKA